jgi:hypothetical protein
MYQFKAAKKQQTANETLAKESHQMASEAQQKAADSVKGLEDKVDKKDDAQIVEMINRATKIIHLIGKRLKVETDNFKLSEDGKVEMSDATVKSVLPDIDMPVEAEIRNGIITLQPRYTISGEGELITFELLRFKWGNELYALYMQTYWAEDTTSETGLRLTLGQFSIGKVETETAEQE